ncbi:MAG: hypothetical protein EXR18_00715 [Flavobacteriaceae bacterium]|nr:hypothetical protein [Flavobacteriaceae bacterium]
MKKKINPLLLLLVFNLLAFCATKENSKAPFTQEIASISFEKWTGGRRETGSGTKVSIKFNKPLQKNIHLKKIYFQNQETEILKENETKYSASFHSNALYQEYHSSDIASKNFNLKDNEAVIEYQNHNKTYFYKCSNIKEIPMIIYE